jgi:hypothetical protein
VKSLTETLLGRCHLFACTQHMKWFSSRAPSSSQFFLARVTKEHGRFTSRHTCQSHCQAERAESDHLQQRNTLPSSTVSTSPVKLMRPFNCGSHLQGHWKLCFNAAVVQIVSGDRRATPTISCRAVTKKLTMPFSYAPEDEDPHDQ